MACATRPPSTCSRSPRRIVTGPSNGWRSTTASSAPSTMPWSCSQRSIVGSASETRTKRPSRAHRQRLERLRVALVDDELDRRDRVAVGVVGGVAELGGDARLEVLGDDVLERLGLVVHAVPRHAEVLGEVELEQPVVAQHLERDALAGPGQLDALVGDVRGEAALGELLDHRRRRRGRDARAARTARWSRPRRRRGARARRSPSRSPRSRRSGARAPRPRPSDAHQQPGREHERDAGQQAGRRAGMQQPARGRRAGSGRAGRSPARSRRRRSRTGTRRRWR